MTWLPAGYDGGCTGTSPNHSVPLTLVCFLIQYFGGSNDDVLKNIYPAQDPNDSDFDFIIVGAGSAGCVVANRLTERSDWKILLLEAGDEQPLVTEVPGLSRFLYRSSVDYSYRVNDTESQKYTRGKMMGGCSAINSMIWARGSRHDYDDWAKSGNTGWSWQEVLPYFKKTENTRIPELLTNYPEYHGKDGYLTISHFPIKDKQYPVILEAFKEVGLEETDYNKGDQIGVSRMQMTTRHGTRFSTNAALIRPIRGVRPNLFVRTKARATRVVVDPETKRATGVEYELTNPDGTVSKKTANAAKEVIVSAGFIESPKLLLLSGIGPAADLEQLNIPVIKDLPGVGQNLRDTYSLTLQLVSNNEPLNRNDTETEDEMYDWLNTHEGPLSARNSINVIALYQTSFENLSGAADMQYELVGESQRAGSRIFGNVTFDMSLLRPESSGSLRLDSVDPVNIQPDIRMNVLGNPSDVDRLVEGVKFARKVANTSAMKSVGLSLSRVPEPGCEDYDFDSDEYIRCYIKKSVRNDSHGTGTCKMGPESDPNAVVDQRLKVYGINGLRVMDTSVIPRLPRSNTNAPAVMVGEKGSDMVKEDVKD